jgi:hypothetical protein
MNDVSLTYRNDCRPVFSINLRSRYEFLKTLDHRATQGAGSHSLNIKKIFPSTILY